MLVSRLYAVKPRPVEADYAGAFKFLRSRVRKRSVVWLFSDLAESESAEQLALHLTYLVPQHLPLCVAISDPALLEIAGRTPDQVTEVYEKAIARQTLLGRTQVAKRLARRGVIVADVPPHHIHAETLNKFFDLKLRARV